MKRQPRILAGTALGLLMASAPLGAFPLSAGAKAELDQRSNTPLLLAQAECAADETAEACAERLQNEQQPPAEEAPPEEAPAEEAPAEEAPAARRSHAHRHATLPRHPRRVYPSSAQP